MMTQYIFVMNVQGFVAKSLMKKKLKRNHALQINFVLQGKTLDVEVF